MKRTMISSVIALVVMMTSAAPVGRAEPSITYAPSSTCSTWTNSELRNFHGGIVNVAPTSTASVECPLLTDRAGTITVDTKVSDRHSTQNVTCHLFRLTDSSIDYSAGSSSSGTNTRPTLTNTIASAPDALYWVACTLPAFTSTTSGIERYTVRAN